MRRSLICCALAAFAFAGCADSAPGAAPAPEAAPAAEAETAAPGAHDDALRAVVAGQWRTPEFVARDRYRNPLETLAFFGVAPGDTVIEITPGGGWYTEILAPYLRESGTYAGAVVDPAKAAERARDYQTRARDQLRAKLGGEPAGVYDRATVVEYDPAAPEFGAPGSADVVLTFRNVHNWRGSGQAAGMFEGFFKVLRSGGTLGVVEHRADADVADDDRSGYVSEAQVIALAEAAGFRLDAKSEINANPKDTKDHPNGVWTLPPGNNHEEADREKYQAIGESDRMTLRFVKP